MSACTVPRAAGRDRRPLGDRGMTANATDVEVSNLRERLATAMVGDLVHRSDCSTSGAPANDPGECDCGGYTWRDLALSLMRQFDHQGCTCTFNSDDCCAFAVVSRAKERISTRATGAAR